MSELYIQKADDPPVSAGCNIYIGWLQSGDIDILPSLNTLKIIYPRWWTASGCEEIKL